MDQTTVEHDLKKFVRENLRVTVSLDSTKEHPKMRRKLQHFLSLRHADSSLQSLYEALLSHAVKAETICPQSGMMFLELFTSSKAAANKGMPHNREELLDILEKNFESRRVYELLKCALEHCGSTTKLSIKKSTSSQSYVEVSDGYSFILKSTIKLPPMTVKNASVACVDGYVESVSEIHHLLTSLSESKKPCFLFVRGMSDDVLHTIKVNHDRKTLHVYPYIVPYDIENVNTLVDIAVVSGTDVISSLKGELISSLTIEKLGHVDECLSSGDVVRMKSTKSAARVRTHVESLKQKIEERQEIQDVLTKRLRSLTSSCVDICIPDDMAYYATSQQLDEGIRIISAVLSKTYDPVDTAKKVYDSFLETIGNRAVCLL